MSTPPPSGPNGATPRVLGLDAWCRVGEGNQPPLVAVQTYRSEKERYDTLSQAMGGRPIFSVLPPNAEAGALPRRVDEWVEHVLAVLDELPVEPPYRLVGWSFGGVVAVEVARRLLEGGTSVAFVGMIDTIRPRLRPQSTSEYVWYHLGEARGIPDTRLRYRYLAVTGLQFLERRFPFAGSVAFRALRFVRPEHTLVKRRDKPRRPRPHDPLIVSIHVSYLNYRGRAVDFPVSLYATAHSCGIADGPALRWAGWLEAGYEFVMIPGGHFSLFEPGNVETVAAAMQRSLDIAEITSAPCG